MTPKKEKDFKYMYVCLIDTHVDSLSNNEKQFEVDSIMEIDKQKYEADEFVALLGEDEEKTEELEEHLKEYENIRGRLHSMNLRLRYNERLKMCVFHCESQVNIDEMVNVIENMSIEKIKSSIVYK